MSGKVNIKASNARIANTVRKYAPLDYQQRVPAATQGNIDQVVRSLTSYEPDWNTFIEILLNVPGLELYRVMNFENPLKMFKRGLTRNGSWIQEIGYGLLKAHSYDKDATDVFSLSEPEVYANYHIQNRKDRYDLSVSPDILEQAFYEEGGLAAFLNGVMSMPTESDNWDEYLIMRELLKLYNDVDGYFNYQVPDLSASADPETDGKHIAQMLRELSRAFTFRDTRYNAAHIPALSNRTVLFVTPKFESLFAVYVQAYAYNLDRVDLLANRVVVVDKLDIDGAQAILADEDFFVCADTKLKNASIYNPKNDVTNYFLHHWGIYSISRFLPAVLLSTAADTEWTIDTPTYTGVTIDSVTSINGVADQAVRGSATKVVWTVAGTNYPSQGVTFALAGDKQLSTNTFIRNNGELWVGTDEQNTSLTVTATSTGDPTKVSAAKTVTIVDPA